MICIRKIYGSCGRNHQIIKKCWDVTWRTDGRTDKRKVENRAVFWIESETAKIDSFSLNSALAWWSRISVWIWVSQTGWVEAVWCSVQVRVKKFVCNLLDRAWIHFVISMQSIPVLICWGCDDRFIAQSLQLQQASHFQRFLEFAFHIFGIFLKSENVFSTRCCSSTSSRSNLFVGKGVCVLESKKQKKPTCSKILKSKNNTPSHL